MILTHHRAVDAVRREATTPRRNPPARDDACENSAGPGADQTTVDSSVATHVRHALSELPPAQHPTLALAYYRGYTQSEAALILGIPLGAVKSRTFGAMALLRERLGPPENAQCARRSG